MTPRLDISYNNHVSLITHILRLVMKHLMCLCIWIRSVWKRLQYMTIIIFQLKQFNRNEDTLYLSLPLPLGPSLLILTIGLYKLCTKGKLLFLCFYWVHAFDAFCVGSLSILLQSLKWSYCRVQFANFYPSHNNSLFKRFEEKRTFLFLLQKIAKHIILLSSIYFRFTNSNVS